MSRISFINKHLGKFRYLLFSIILATVLYAGVNLLSSLIFGFVIDNVISQNPIDNDILILLSDLLGGTDEIRTHLWKVALLLICIYLSVAVLMSYRQRMQGVVSEKLVENIRNDLYSHIQFLPYSYHVKTKSGELIQKCTSDVDMVRRFFAGQLAEIFYILATAFIALYILYSINFKLAIVASISLPIIFLYSYFFFKQVQKQFLLSDEAEAVMSDVIQESLSGIRVVKAFNREKYEIEKFLKKSSDYSDITYKMIRYLGIYWSSSYVICLLGILSVVVAGIFAVRNGELTIGNFTVFVSYQTMILYPIRQLGRIMTDFGKVTVSLQRLVDIINEKEEDLASGIVCDLNGDIEYRHVFFGYDDQEVLKDISFKIKQNQTVAIIGPTGSGKSSIAYLLSRLYDPQKGDIYINGYNIKDINKNYLRENVGIVLQEPFLFSRTIAANLKIARPDLSDEEMFEATRIAAVHEVISGFDQGYNTIVGEKGVTLSGGQKQRVAIARTLIKRTPILIFDDSLSAVDTQTDAMIREALNQFHGNRTTIIITQRIASAKDCDLILVVEDGKITQSGTHEELITKPGLYQRVFAIQTRNENEGAVNING